LFVAFIARHLVLFCMFEIAPCLLSFTLSLGRRQIKKMRLSLSAIHVRSTNIKVTVLCDATSQKSSTSFDAMSMSGARDGVADVVRVRLGVLEGEPKEVAMQLADVIGGVPR
jgi:hypothetical protein